MVDPRSSTSAKPKALTVPKKTLAPVVANSDPAALENAIRGLAYQLYEGRGREHGKDQQDWVQAEHEILDQRP
jgi:hypothetical protein